MRQADGFRVVHRKAGHWDIETSTEGRIFAIRGGPGKYYIRDERPEARGKGNIHFATVSACMAYICDLLMFELIVAEGQTPVVIESWNV